MPGLLTHFCFSKHVLKKDSPLIRIGTQGPDPFFAYGNLPFAERNEKNKVPLFGATLHSLDPAPVFAKLFEIANASEEKQTLYEYVDGMLMHYALDCLAHPFIFYRTGYSNDQDTNAKYMLHHNFFETFMDKEVMLYFKEKEKPHKTIPWKGMDLKSIDHMYDLLNQELHIIDADYPEDSFSTSLHDYHMIHRILLSKHGIKRKLIGAFFGKHSKGYAYSYPVNLKERGDIDYMNMGKQEWKTPSEGIIHNESIVEIFEKAKNKYLRLHEIFEASKSGEDPLFSLDAEMHSYNHNGCKADNQNMKYFSLAWEIDW